MATPIYYGTLPNFILTTFTPTHSHYNVTEEMHLGYLNAFSDHYTRFIQDGQLLTFYKHVMDKILVLAIEYGSSSLIIDNFTLGSAVTVTHSNISLRSFVQHIRKSTTLTNFLRVFALYSRTLLPNCSLGYAKSYGLALINPKVLTDFSDGANDLTTAELAIILSGKQAEYIRMTRLAELFTNNPTLRFPNEPLIGTSRTLTHQKIQILVFRIIHKFNNLGILGNFES